MLSGGALRTTIGEFRFDGAAVSISTYQDIYEAVDWIPSIELISDPTLAEILGRNNFSLVITRENLISEPNIVPLTPPSLFGAEQAYLQMTMDSGSNTSPVPWVFFLASLDSLTIVPEPQSFVLCATALALSRRRRKQHAASY